MTQVGVVVAEVVVFVVVLVLLPVQVKVRGLCLFDHRLQITSAFR